MTSTATSTFTSVLHATVGTAAAALEKRVDVWADKLDGVAAGGHTSGGLAGLADKGIDELAEGGGAKRKATAEGAKATLHGKNPLWPAIKGAWEAGTPVVRAAIIAGLASSILLLVLSPVPLLVFLLSLLILAAVQRARSSKRQDA
jgi:hypothetical protein